MRRIVQTVVVPKLMAICILASLLVAAIVFARGLQMYPASGAHIVVDRFQSMPDEQSQPLLSKEITSPNPDPENRLSQASAPYLGNPTSATRYAGTQLEPFAPGERCEAQVFLGIRHCALDAYEILRIDPSAPFVHIRTVLPLGFDRDGTYQECNDLLPPDSVPGGTSAGPGCHVQGYYPGELLSHMAARYPRAVAAFNGDFFSPSYAHGAMGLTVREGMRLDGGPQDHDQREVQRSSLSISTSGAVRIGIVPRQSLPDPSQPWDWVPDPSDFYTTVGGLPQLVQDGEVLDINQQCEIEEGWCADPFRQRARTAVGSTQQGQLMIVVIPEHAGMRLQALAELMQQLGAWDAINLDGGGSSQLWYRGEYLVYSPRPLAQGLIVESITTTIWNTVSQSPLE